MTDFHDTIPAPPPLPSRRAERMRAWGPVLLGIAAVIGALGSLATGAVTVQTEDPGVRAELGQLREDLRQRDREAADLRERVRQTEKSNDAEAAERRKAWAEIVYLQTFHPPR